MKSNLYVAKRPANPLGDLPPVDFRALLDAPAPPKETVTIKAGSVRQRVTRRRFYDLSQVPNAISIIRPLPEPDEVIHAVMDGSFDGWSIIPAIRQLSGQPITELWIATLGFNLTNNQHLCDMLDNGDVQAVTVLCSCYFRESDKDTFQPAKERLEQRGQRLFAARNHAKIILAATGGRHFVVESSANLRSCQNVEQFTLTQSKAVFDFHRTWVEQLTQATP
jgi:hypothetical protein